MKAFKRCHKIRQTVLDNYDELKAKADTSKSDDFPSRAELQDQIKEVEEWLADCENADEMDGVDDTTSAGHTDD